MRKYTVENRSKYTELITFDELNSKGEKIQLEIVKCTNPGGKHSLPYLWKKHGYIDRILETYWSITTYATEDGGKVLAGGATIHRPSYQKMESSQVINFEWCLKQPKRTAKSL